MFERFTDRARRVVVLAQEESRLLNHNYIGTEHILLGLIHEGQGVAAKALESMEISLVEVRSQVQEIIGQGATASSRHIPFTPRAKKVLELSLREALALGHNYIGTEHILLGLIREGEGVAAQVLVRMGADLNRVRQQVIQLLQGYTGKGETHPEEPPEAAGVMPGLSQETHSVMYLARQMARSAGHDRVEPADILLGLLRSAELDVAVLLQRLGVDLTVLKQRLDEMGSQTSREGKGSERRPGRRRSEEIRALDTRIAEARRMKEEAIDAQDFGRAAGFRDEEKQLLQARARLERVAESDTVSSELDEEEGRDSEDRPEE
jgi:ATP-dependent Clp protease ATP-binding subunit ClpA